MNLRVLKKSRKAPEAGDIFVMLPSDGLYLYGRVVATDVNAGGFDGSNLIYLYRMRSRKKEPVPQLSCDQLLIPPIMTNRLPWSRGYFEFLEHRKLSPSDHLPQHCFRDSLRNLFFDERGNRLPGPVGPVGDWGLDSFRTIDDAISTALGIPLAPESDDDYK